MYGVEDTDYKQKAQLSLSRPVSIYGAQYRTKNWQKATQDDPLLNGIVLDGLSPLHTNCLLEIACRIVGLDWNSCLRTCKSWNRFFSKIFLRTDYTYHMYQLEFDFWGKRYCYDVDLRLPWRVVKMSLLCKALPEWEPKKGQTKTKYYRFLSAGKQFDEDDSLENSIISHHHTIKVTGRFGVNAEPIQHDDKELMAEFQQVKRIIKETGRDLYWFPVKKKSNSLET